MKFEDLITLINDDYTPTAFTNGELKNAVGEN